jgi:hypothetical protein
VAHSSGGGSSRVKNALGAIGATVAVLAAVVGVLFQIDPRLSPCLGTREAAFTGVPVLPHYPYRQFLLDLGESGADAAKHPNVYGAEVRYTYRADDLRGTSLTLRTTLVTVARDGTVGALVAGEDLLPGLSFTPTQCSQATGSVLFVPVPHPRLRYKVVLELYPGQGFTDRLALAETAVFPG